MKWFRFYSEFMDDPKLAMMSDSDQLIWIKVLCLASENKVRGFIFLADEEVCWKLRISLETWRHAIDKFRAKGMIEHHEKGYKITNWDSRQFESDSSAKRVAKHRKDKKKNIETPKKLNCNVTVTPSDTDTDTDTDQKISVDPIITACVLAEPTSEPVGHVNSDWSDDDPKRLAQEKRGTSEQVLAKIPSEMRESFEKFWGWYCKFCKDRAASAGSKKQAAIAWESLVKSDFRGHGFEGFLQGWRLFAKRHGDNKSGIPHACRFLFVTGRGSGVWEDAIEQEQSSQFADSSLLRAHSSEPARGHSRVYTSADFDHDYREGRSPEEWSAFLETLKTKPQPQSA